MRDLTGERFGKLVVLRNDDCKKRYVTCLCDCGTQKSILRYSLLKGRTIRCGCVHSNYLHNLARKHGMYNSRFYSIWKGIKRRTTNPKAPEYENYGGAGVTICDRWLDFSNFYKDMYGSYATHVKHFGIKDTSIERYDVFGNYEPNNCGWATRAEQSVNKRKTNRYLINGEYLSPVQISNKYHLDIGTVLYRLKHWPIQDITKEPMKGGCHVAAY